MRLLVGQLAYLNTLPFEPLAGVRIFRATPSGIGQLAAAGELDAGVLSVVDLMRNGDRYSALLDSGSGFGIACRERAGSVFLVSRRPPAELDGETIEISSETSTAVLLLRLWLERRLGVRSLRYRRGIVRRHAALLVIGDAALRERERPDPAYPHRVDLASAWREWTGFPFVFAVWSARRSLLPAIRLELARTVEDAITRGIDRIPQIAAEAAGALGGAPTIARYLSDFTYRLGAEEHRGLECFCRMLLEHRLLAPPGPAAPTA